jgi:hypothetical protein
MSRKLKSKSSVYSYLKSKGVLEHEMHDQIQSARKEYWKEYRSKWRNKKRKTNKEFTVSFNVAEVKELTKEAKRHKLSRPKFIKQVFFSYLNRTFVVPDSKEVKLIAQYLALVYNEIQQLYEDDRIEGKVKHEALETIWKLERQILPLLNNPKPIEIYITEHILKSPSNKNQLLNLMHSL